MNILEAVKKGFGQAPKLLNVILVFFVFNAIVGLISLPLANPDRASNPGIIAISIVSSVLFFLLFIFIQGGALGLVKDQIKTQTASMAQFVNYGKKFYVRILGLLLIYVLVAVGVVLLLSLVSAGVLLLGDNIVTRSLVAAIVTAAAIGVITILIYPIYVVVVEDSSSVLSFKKGVTTAKDNFWTTLGLFVVMLLISLIVAMVIGLIVGLATTPLPTGISQIILVIVNAAVQSYVPIVMMVAFMNFYMSLTGGSSEAPVQEPE